MGNDSAKSELERLFSTKVGEMAEELSGVSDALRNGVPASALDRACSIAHSLHGAGTMYGFPSVSELGAALERLVKALRAGQVAAGPRVADLVGACAAALREVAGSRRDGEGGSAVLSELAWKCECALHRAPADDGAASTAVSSAPT